MFDSTAGNWSLRTYGDTACFSRLEIIDTPYSRCTNAIRAVYSDWQCRQMWLDLIEPAQASGNWTLVQQRVMVELRDAFPELGDDIPDPVLISGDIFDTAWHWAKPEYDDISNGEHAEWAAQPLGDEQVCLSSESVHIYYAGWSEAALRSARQCLLTRMTGDLLGNLTAVYAARDVAVPGSGWWTSSNYQDIPPATGEKHWSNEVWWPYDYTAAYSSGFCNTSNVVLTDYPTVVADN